MDIVNLNRTAVVILGMHRSGTSAVAGIISLFGSKNPKTLMEAADDNPNGFFESQLVVDLNNEILNYIGLAWDSVCEPLLNDYIIFDLLREYKDRATLLIKEEYQGESFIYIKDPRMCILFPFWENILLSLGYNIRIILVYRNPLEVARSLRKRNRFSEQKSFMLWLTHNISAEFNTRNCERYFINYSDLNKISYKDYLGAMYKFLFKNDLPYETFEKIENFLSFEGKNYNLDSDFFNRNDVHPTVSDYYKCLISNNNENFIENSDKIIKEFNIFIENYIYFIKAFEEELFKRIKNYNNTTPRSNITNLKERLPENLYNDKTENLYNDKKSNKYNKFKIKKIKKILFASILLMSISINIYEFFYLKFKVF
jgi:hypothetical protein